MTGEVLPGNGPGSSGGTRARIRHRLVRPVVVDRGRGATAGPAEEPATLTSSDNGLVRLGVLGHDEVEQVASALLLASRGGTLEVVVDLTELTSVSADGLRLLADLVGHGDRSVIVLHARSGSNPQRQLERAGIDHRAS